jgi:hypothetical protein
MLAMYGRELSGEEQWIRNFYIAWDALEAELKKPFTAMPTDQQKPFRPLFDSYMEEENRITLLITGAIKLGDWQTIQRVADAVKFLHSKRKFLVSVDKERQALLMLATFLREQNEKWPLKRVATLLGKRFSEDGYAALRRKCKQLGVPLCPARQTRGK